MAPRLRNALEFALAVAAGVVFLGALASTGEVRTPRYSPLHLWLWLALVSPILEEFAFRGFVQSELSKRFHGRAGGVSSANLGTSMIFLGMHALQNPSAWVVLVLVPSLAYGHFRERYDSLAAPILLHLLHNLLYFGLFGIPREVVVSP